MFVVLLKVKFEKLFRYFKVLRMMSILRHKGVDKLNVKLYRDNQIVEIMIIGGSKSYGPS